MLLAIWREVTYWHGHSANTLEIKHRPDDQDMAQTK
jgi:hypothetical protein